MGGGGVGRGKEGIEGKEEKVREEIGHDEPQTTNTISPQASQDEHLVLVVQSGLLEEGG